MKKRNRSEESTVPDDYLKALNNKYDTWLNDWMAHKIDRENSDVIKSDINEVVMSPMLRKIMDDTHMHVKKALNWVWFVGFLGVLTVLIF